MKRFFYQAGARSKFYSITGKPIFVSEQPKIRPYILYNSPSLSYQKFCFSNISISLPLEEAKDEELKTPLIGEMNLNPLQIALIDEKKHLNQRWTALEQMLTTLVTNRDDGLKKILDLELQSVDIPEDSTKRVKITLLIKSLSTQCNELKSQISYVEKQISDVEKQISDVNTKIKLLEDQIQLSNPLNCKAKAELNKLLSPTLLNLIPLKDYQKALNLLTSHFDYLPMEQILQSNDPALAQCWLYFSFFS